MTDENKPQWQPKMGMSIFDFILSCVFFLGLCWSAGGILYLFFCILLGRPSAALVTIGIGLLLIVLSSGIIMMVSCLQDKRNEKVQLKTKMDQIEIKLNLWREKMQEEEDAYKENEELKRQQNDQE